MKVAAVPVSATDTGRASRTLLNTTLDVSAAYPTTEVTHNISKETTRKEIIKIDGCEEFIKRMNTINFSAGHVNAVEFCTDLFGMPELDEMLDAFNEYRNANKQALEHAESTGHLTV